MIYVTHDQVEAMTLADRIVVLNKGRVEQVGTPLELYQRSGQPLRRPVHRLARDEHPAGRGSGRTVGPGAWGTVPCAIAGAGRRRSGALHLGVRPEDLALAPDGARAF